MVIQHNVLAANAQRQYNITGKRKKDHTEKLSSGYRINRAADDAAGLAISEKMRRQVRGLTRGVQNAEDGVSLCQVADGALNEVHDMIQRLNELSVQAANGSNSDADRGLIQDEVGQLLTEIDRISDTTTFNEHNIFGGAKVGGMAEVSKVASTQVICGDFTVQGGTLGTDFDFKDGTLTIKTSRAVIIQNTDPSKATSNRIEVAKDVDANIALQGVNIDVSGKGDTAAFKIADDSKGDVKITLDGTNVLKSGANCAGLEKNGNAADTGTLTILGTDTGTITVNGGNYAAGIGSGKDYSTRNITIKSGTVTANGGFDGAGIGGGSGFYKSGAGNGINITIEGGTVTAIGGGHAPGIGGGCGGGGKSDTGAGNNITISGGTVTAKGGGGGDNAGAGIGGGWGGTGSNITIDGGNVTVTSLDNGQCIGDGAGAVSMGINNTVAGVTAPKDTNSTHTFPLGAGTPIYATVPSLTAATELTSQSSITPRKKWWIQSGNDANDGMNIYIDTMNTKVLGLTGLNVTRNYDVKLFKEPEPVRNKDESEAGYAKRKAEWAERDAARKAEWAEYEKESPITRIGGALTYVSRMRAKIGAQQNRLEHTIANENNIVENTTAAESRIRDTDMAKEMVGFSLTNILAQAGETMMAQANQSNQGVMALLG